MSVIVLDQRLHTVWQTWYIELQRHYVKCLNYEYVLTTL